MNFYPTGRAYRNMFVGAGFSEQEMNTVSDSFVESLLVFGDAHELRNEMEPVANQPKNMPP